MARLSIIRLITVHGPHSAGLQYDKMQ